MINEILTRMNCPFSPIAVTQLLHEEDNEPYQVWKIDTETDSYILKEAKEYEAEVYETLLKNISSVPALYKTCIIQDKTYLLMEYVEGQNLQKCTRSALLLALDALIEMQNATWNSQTYTGCAFSFELSQKGRKKRGEYLNDPQLEEAYSKFLDLYASVPRALCHDDLLPFNIIVSRDRAVLIDWEYAGILPYPTSFARLIAYGEEADDAFFHMTQTDREFAIDYYYEKLLKVKGISRIDWQRTLDYFLLYEYCEWIMVGNKYGVTAEPFYQKYLPIAKRHAKKLLQK